MIRGELHASQRLSRAFTLVELLATIAIIGLLVGLLLPAIQSARESSRRSSCHNNFKNIGTGLANYVQANGDVYPNGEVSMGVPTTTGSSARIDHGSLPMYLLPYIGYDSLYAGYDMREPRLSWSSSLGTVVMEGAGMENNKATVPNVSPARLIRDTVIPPYVCPSDYVAGTPVTLARYDIPAWKGARLNYIGSCGPNGSYPSNGGGLRNDCGLGDQLDTQYGKPHTGSNRVPGVFGFLSDPRDINPRPTPPVRQISDWRCRVAAVRDGLSNTILMGEALPDCAWFLFLGWGWPTNLSGRGNTLVFLNYNTCDMGPHGDGADPCSKPGPGGGPGPVGMQSEMSVGFRSRHPGGVSFLMGDGRIVFLSESIDHPTLQRLGAKADGEVLDEGKL